MILCIGTTPAAQRVMVFRRLTLDTVNRATTTLDGVAGKSVNVAKVLKTLGENPIALGFEGGTWGAALRSLLSALQIEHNFVRVAAPTRQCVTVIDEAAGTQTELVEESRPVTAEDYANLIGLFQGHIMRCRAVVMSGSLAPGGQTDFYARCTRLAQQTGVLSVVDAQGEPLVRTLEAKPGLVKPNRTELAATVGCSLASETELMAAMRELYARGAQRVVVTGGKETVFAFDGTRSWRAVPPSITARNPIGSGDAFTAGLVWRLLKGEDLGEALRWAAATGAANALSLMPGELKKADVERLRDEVRIERV